VTGGGEKRVREKNLEIWGGRIRNTVYFEGIVIEYLGRERKKGDSFRCNLYYLKINLERGRNPKGVELTRARQFRGDKEKGGGWRITKWRRQEEKRVGYVSFERDLLPKKEKKEGSTSDKEKTT